PCSHQIEAYIVLGQKVPIEAFHNQWRLIADPIPESLDALKIDLKSKAESLCNLPEHALRRAYNELLKVQSGGFELVPIGAPATKINTRGRPTGSKKNWSKHKTKPRDPSAFEYLAVPKTKPPRKCSNCKNTGHRKDKCPLIPHLDKPTLEELQLDQDDDTASSEADQVVSTSRRNGIEYEKDNSDSEFGQPLEKIPKELDLDSDSEVEDDSPICPFCDNPLPSQPSKKLQSLIELLTKQPNATKTPRPGNPHAMSLPMSETIAFCAMHYAEAKYVPIGIKNGWPSSINFDDLSRRVETFIPDLQQIINRHIESEYLTGALHILQTHGARRMDSVWHGDLTFELEQPGYYGGRGLEIIYQTLHSHFLHPKASNRFENTSLSPESWVRTVLIPEVSLRLIANDLKVSISNPKVKETLESSRAYGMAMFPADGDNF
ncbi:hypothetical protein DFH28DRAFT_1174950, partial [Melampsora americana]